MKFFTKNPATGKEIQEYHLATNDEVMERVKISQDAFSSWRQVEAHKRARLVFKLAEVLEDNCEEFAHLITDEMGKTIKESRAEIQKCATLCRYYSENAPKWLADESVKADGKSHAVLYQPLGIVLTIMPWNFPFWQAFRFAVPAIVAGNVSILKHSNVVAGCALAIEKCMNLAGFPAGVFQTVITDHKVTENLIRDDRISGVSFTGSTQVGKKIGKIAGEELKKVVLELGGSDPFIVLPDADLKEAAAAAAIGRLINAGQSCIAAKRFIVHKDVAKEFTDLFVAEMEMRKVGDPKDEQSDLGPLMNAKSADEIEEQLNDATTKGAKILCGGKREGNSYFLPTVLGNVDQGMRVASEEVFGPVAPIMIVESVDEAIEVANGTEFGLGASIWTRDSTLGREVANKIDAGALFINSIVKSDPRMPFGGVKKSGVGRELARFGLREFLNIKGYNYY